MNLAHVLERGPDDAVALIADEQRWTYRTLRAATAELARQLSASGLLPGDRIGLVAANNPAFVVGAFAGLGAGLVVVPLNPQSPGPELARELAVTGARVVLADRASAERFAAAELGVTRIVSVGAGSAIASASITAFAPVEVDRDTPAFLLFTSGTAGPPAAAILSHANLRANLDQVAAHHGAEVLSTDVVLAIAPLCHVFGLNAVLHPALEAGATVVLVEHFEPSAALAAIAAHHVTVVSGPPALWDALAHSCHDPAVFADVRLAVSGAAPLDDRTVAAVSTRCGVSLRQGYGLTEAAPAVALSIGTDAPASSVGVPVPGLEVRLVDEVGDDVPIGDEGEIWVRGPNVFQGYWGDRDATDRAIDGHGWLRTGDIAVVDERGWLTLVDRAKDLIIVSGFNVHPGEVEAVILAFPGVEEAAVIGVADSGSGERLEASVVLTNGAAVSEAELIEHCRGQLARYKVPSVVRFAETLPHGLTGKVLRRALRRPLEES